MALEEYKKEDIEIAPKIEKLDLSKIKNPILKEMVDVGLITEQGFRISGNGMIVRKLEKNWERLNKMESHLWKISEDAKAIRGEQRENKR